MMELKDFEDKDIVDLSKDNVKGIDDNEDKKKEKEAAQTDFEDTLKFLVESIGDKKISKAEVSTSLSDSPAVLAQAEYGMSPQMQKYMKARAVAMGDEMDLGGGVGQASVLQINPDHPILQKLKAKVDLGQPGDDAKRIAQLLYNVAALRGGYEIEDGKQFATLVTELMTSQ